MHFAVRVSIDRRNVGEKLRRGSHSQWQPRCRAALRARYTVGHGEETMQLDIAVGSRAEQVER
jgi:hypothetical protein